MTLATIWAGALPYPHTLENELGAEEVAIVGGMTVLAGVGTDVAVVVAGAMITGT